MHSAPWYCILLCCALALALQAVIYAATVDWDQDKRRAKDGSPLLPHQDLRYYARGVFTWPQVMHVLVLGGGRHAGQVVAHSLPSAASLWATGAASRCRTCLTDREHVSICQAKAHHACREALAAYDGARRTSMPHGNLGLPLQCNAVLHFQVACLFVAPVHTVHPACRDLC